MENVDITAAGRQRSDLWEKASFGVGKMDAERRVLNLRVGLFTDRCFLRCYQSALHLLLGHDKCAFSQEPRPQVAALWHKTKKHRVAGSCASLIPTEATLLLTLQRAYKDPKHRHCDRSFSFCIIQFALSSPLNCHNDTNPIALNYSRPWSALPYMLVSGH